MTPPLIPSSQEYRFQLDGDGAMRCLHGEAEAFLDMLGSPLPPAPVDLYTFTTALERAVSHHMGSAVTMEIRLKNQRGSTNGALLVTVALKFIDTTDLAIKDDGAFSIPISTKTLFFNAPVGYLIEDESANIIAVNPEIVAMFGYAIEELLRMKAYHLAGVENHDFVQDNIRKILSGQILTHEVVNYRKDGSRVHVELREIAITLPDGNPGILVVAHDISKRKIAEERLAAIQKTFLQFLSEPDSNIHELLATCADILSIDSAFYFRENEQSLSNVTSLHRDGTVELPAHIRQAMVRDAIVSDADIVFREYNGVDFATDTDHPAFDQCLFVCVPIRWNRETVAFLCLTFPKDTQVSDEDRHFLLLVGGVLAVEESRYRSIVALQKSEEFHRVIVEMSPSGIALTDPDGTFLYVNKRCAFQFGFVDPVEMHGRNIGEFLSEEDRTRGQIDKELLLAHGILGNTRYDFHRLDGTMFAGEIWSVLTKDQWGGDIRFVLLMNDVSERVEIEQQLISAKEHAEQADQLKREFIINISHEVRAPLNIIHGYINIIRSELAHHTQDRQAQYFESIERAIQRLMKMVEEILNVSTIESNTFPIQFESIDLVTHVERTLQDMRSLIEGKGLKLIFLRECKAARVDADRYCLEQTFTNLLDNAAKFTTVGSITVRLYEADGMPCCDIADTGIGMDDEFLPRVFNHFSQEQSGFTRPYYGMGLGLALVKRYVEMNNGRIEVRSTKNVGTVFTLRFPGGTVSSIGVNAASLPVLSSEVRDHGLEKPRLLIVEDDIPSQNFMRILLSKYYDLALVSNAEEAWIVLHEQAIDLVLSDITLLGGGDGIALLKKIRSSASFGQMPVIMVTAHTSRDTIYECETAGCSAFVVKPFNPLALRKMIGDCLSTPNA